MFLLTLRTSRPLRTTIHHSVCTAKQALLSFANDHYEVHQSQPAPTADPTDAPILKPGPDRYGKR